MQICNVGGNNRIEKDIAEINAIEKWEFIGGYYEIEDKIIEKLDNEKFIENGKS